MEISPYLVDVVVFLATSTVIVFEPLFPSLELTIIHSFPGVQVQSQSEEMVIENFPPSHLDDKEVGETDK